MRPFQPGLSARHHRPPLSFPSSCNRKDRRAKTLTICLPLHAQSLEGQARRSRFEDPTHVESLTRLWQRKRDVRGRSNQPSGHRNASRAVLQLGQVPARPSSGPSAQGATCRKVAPAAASQGKRAPERGAWLPSAPTARWFATERIPAQRITVQRRAVTPDPRTKNGGTHACGPRLFSSCLCIQSQDGSRRQIGRASLPSRTCVQPRAAGASSSQSAATVIQPIARSCAAMRGS